MAFREDRLIEHAHGAVAPLSFSKMQLQIPRFAKSQNYLFLHSPALLSDFAQLIHYVGLTNVIMLADDVD